MKVEIFDVEHGACSLITTSGGQHVMIDCGHKTGSSVETQSILQALYPSMFLQNNLGLPSGLTAAQTLLGTPSPTSTGWRPSDELKRRGIQEIDKLIISNYDEDHLSDLPNIREQRIHVWEIVGNPTVSMNSLKNLKKNGIGDGVGTAIDLLENFQHTFSPRQIREIYLYHFWIRYNPLLSMNTNNLSLVTFVSINDLHMIFPGDIEATAWDMLLSNNDFLAHLKRVNVFIASHHGRKNGYHNEVFKNGRCSPVLVIISDKSIMHSTQESAASRYGSHASGITIKGQHRKVLTTRNDGHIRFDFDQFGKANVNVA
jgi:beta-lactamase superfamily II metal-dependent hydrolase